MIELKRLNGKPFILNAELIATIEATPDTIITTVNGDKVVVSNTVEEVIEKVIDYKRRILAFPTVISSG